MIEKGLTIFVIIITFGVPSIIVNGKFKLMARVDKYVMILILKQSL